MVNRAPGPTGPATDAWALLARIDWRSDPPIDWSRPAGDASSWIEPSGRAGDAACRQCHEDIAARYAKHGMATTGLVAIPRGGSPALRAAFDAGAIVQHVGSGFAYRPFRDGDRFFVEERIDGDGGATLHTTTVEITHTYAAGRIGQAFGYVRGGYVYQVPVDWYPGARRWALDPSFGGGNARFGRPFLSFCLGCHVDAPARRGSSPDLVRLPLSAGVGCEHCHGAGLVHARSSGTESMLDLATLPPARKLDICAQCHLQGTAEILRPGREIFAYQPGQALHRHRVNFVERTAHADRFQLVGQVDRMARSKCFTASSGALTCTTCHDPHTSSRAQPAASWRAACLTCHQDASCTAPREARAARGDACSECHMRRDTATDFRVAVPGVSLPIVDHWIRRTFEPPSPVDTIVTRQPAGDVRPFVELLGEELDGPHLEAVRAVGLHVSGRTRVALPRLVESAGDRPPLRELYAYLADAYGQVAAAMSDAAMRAEAVAARRRALAAAVRAAPDDIATLLDYAASVADDDPAEARHAIARALAIDPAHPDALTRRAVDAFLVGAKEDARRDAEHAARIAPHPLEPHVILAILARDDGDVAGAIRHLDSARAAAPGDLAVLDELAALLARAGRADEAAPLATIRAGFVERGARPEHSRARRLLAPQ